MIQRPAFDVQIYNLWARRVDASRDPDNWLLVVRDCPVPVPTDSQGNVIEGSASPVRNVQACVYHPGHSVIVKVFGMFSIENRRGEIDTAMQENYPGIPWIHTSDLERADANKFHASVSRLMSRSAAGVLSRHGEWLTIDAMREKATV